MKARFNRIDVGCYADGACGHQYVREALADLVSREGRHDLAQELLAPMSDDASEEQDAIDVLNDKCSPGVYFTFSDGDLLLVEEGWED